MVPYHITYRRYRPISLCGYTVPLRFIIVSGRYLPMKNEWHNFTISTFTVWKTGKKREKCKQHIYVLTYPVYGLPAHPHLRCCFAVGRLQMITHFSVTSGPSAVVEVVELFCLFLLTHPPSTDCVQYCTHTLLVYSFTSIHSHGVHTLCTNKQLTHVHSITRPEKTGSGCHTQQNCHIHPPT